MGWKKAPCFLLAFMAIIGCLSIPAVAAEDKVYEEEVIEARATGEFRLDVPANTIMRASTDFPVEIGEKVTITASYSPASASVDFGLIDPNDLFHLVRASGGSFKQTIQIDQRGNDIFAIRNNSSYKVSVSGFVNY